MEPKEVDFIKVGKRLERWEDWLSEDMSFRLD
jgi:hypothetical protein